MSSKILSNRKFIVSLTSTFIIGLIAHAYMFFNSAISMDALNAMYASPTEERLKISIGRFLVPIFRRMYGSMTLPWVVGFLSLLCIAISTYEISNLLNINSNIFVILSAGILVTNLSVTVSLATYIHESLFSMLALLFSVYAVKMITKKSVKASLIGALLLFLSLGLYQSYLCVTTTLIIFYLIHQLTYKDRKDCLSIIIHSICTVVAGIVLYFIGTKVSCLIFNVESESSFNLNLINNTYIAYKYVLRNLLLPYTVLPSILISAIYLSIIILVFYLISKRCVDSKKYSELAFIILLLLVTPISIGAFRIVCSYIHELMIYAIWIIFVFSASVFENEFSNTNTKYINKVVYILLVVIIWNNILVSNTCYLKKEMEDKATLSVMTRVTYDMEKQDNYQMGQTEIMFMGNGPYYAYMQGYETVYRITGVDYRGPIFDSNLWYFNDYQAYYDNVLDYPLKCVTPEYFEEHLEEYENLNIPAFPEDGYIQNINGVLVINMGN